MLISGSAAALKIALIAALWAAVVGFFLVMRYRRQAEESVTKLELQERAHRAELKQARAAEGKELPEPVEGHTFTFGADRFRRTSRPL